MPSCRAIVSVSRSRKMRSAITSRCRAGGGGRMPADLVPGPPGPGERPRDLVLSQLRVTGHGDYRPQAGRPVVLEKPGDLRLLVVAHTRLTRQDPRSAYRRRGIGPQAW